MFFYIVNVTRTYMLLSALFFMLSKISFLVAMILPWKILAVASGAGSAYFDYLSFFDGLDVKVQVAYLGAIVVSFFILHLVFEFVFDVLVRKGAEKAIHNNKKTGVFNNYRSFAKKIYGHYAVFFSALLYSFLVFILLGFYYHSLILNFIIYISISFSILFLVIRFFKLTAQGSSKWLPAFYKIWWHVGFVFALIWVINEYWHGVMPDLIVAFISLLLYRQVLMMMTMVFSSGHLIYDNRFRAGQIFSLTPNSEYQIKSELNTDFEQLVANIEEQKWLDEIWKSKYSSPADNVMKKTCHIVEGGNVAYITVVPRNNELLDGLLIKFYNKNREALAEQEIALLESAKTDWPLMTLLEHKKVNGFIALVCRWPAGSAWLHETERATIEPELRNKLLTCELSSRVIELYQRSQVGLLDRLKVISWEHLQAYSGATASKVDWANVEAHLTKILADIAGLPEQLNLNPLGGRMAFGSKDAPKLANVTRWAWEPLGSGWPLNRLKDLDRALVEAALERAELVDVDPARVNLVARVYEFERRYRNKNYAGAVNVLSILLKHYDETYLKQSVAAEKPSLASSE